MVGSDFVSEAEWNAYLNESITWLYDLLVGAYGSEYYATSKDFSLVNNQEFYDFDSDISLSDSFYKLLGISLVPANQEEIPLRKFTFRDRHRYSGTYSWNRYNYTTLRYRLRGNGIWFTPTPVGTDTIRMWYVPAAQVMTDDGDTVDGIAGWEELVEVDSAIKALKKEESDATDLERERALLMERITRMAMNRDMAEPEKVTDIYSTFIDSEFGYEY
jgi:hypothetical protein